MFYTIIDNELKEYSDIKENLNHPEIAKNLEGVSSKQFVENKDKYEVKKGRIIDISKTDDYQKKATARENLSAQAKLQSQIEELDKKRVRAICEPEIKDEKTGQTWLEFYTLQIQDYREQLEKFKQNGENYATN